MLVSETTPDYRELEPEAIAADVLKILRNVSATAMNYRSSIPSRLLTPEMQADAKKFFELTVRTFEVANQILTGLNLTHVDFADEGTPYREPISDATVRVDWTESNFFYQTVGGSVVDLSQVTGFSRAK